jgi:hypothetical protein
MAPTILGNRKAGGARPALSKRSMRKLTLRERHGGIVSSPRSNDPGYPRHQHPDLRPAQSARTTSAGISHDHSGPRNATVRKRGYFCGIRRSHPPPRFNRSHSEIATVLRTIRDEGVWVKPSERVRACSDPDDDIFLGMRAGCRSALPRDRQCQGFSRRMG